MSRILSKWREEGLAGVLRAVARRADPRRRPVMHPVRAALRDVLARDEFVIVQIGAHVGNTPNDPLYRAVLPRLKEGRGRLLLVEPVKEYFEQLVENYRGVPNVSFENAAVAERSGEASFFRLGVDPVQHGFPEWLTQLGSLKEQRMRELWERYEADPELQRFYLEHRVEERVRCVAFDELLRKHDIAAVDLLQIDVEGYELEILRTIDFRAVPIRFVNYESVLLHDNKPVVEALMRRAGYRLEDYGQDTFAHKPADAPLRAVWTRRWGRFDLPPWARDA